MPLYKQFEKFSKKQIIDFINEHLNSIEQEKLEHDFKKGEELTKLFDKEKYCNNFSSIQEAFKKELAKDLSAFANAIGGVIIYGVKEKIGIDADIKIDKFKKEKLEQVINELTFPNTDATVKIIEHPEEQDSCIVCIIIPETQKGAIQSRKDFKYYRRYGTHNNPMPHYDIQMINNKIIHPKVELIDYTYSLDLNSRNEAILAISNIKIKNTGRIFAKKVALSIVIPDEFRFNYYNQTCDKILDDNTILREFQSLFPNLSVQSGENINISFSRDLKIDFQTIKLNVYSDSSPFEEINLFINMPELEKYRERKMVLYKEQLIDNDICTTDIKKAMDWLRIDEDMLVEYLMESQL